ncbi:MAG: cyclic nucleotide-binding domain-containing protein [Candidatus Dadabacteria bacterium]|nr:MAG: cyclic nucleotide-binding domain-containing protein [Candidatus Dadabacteria bacterium]
MAEPVELLAQIALFQDLSPNELERIAALAKEVSFSKNDSIFAEGDAGNALYMIIEGEVRIAKIIPGIGEEALAILKPGSFFGEMALLDDSPRSAHAIAHTAARLFAIERDQFESLLFVDKELAYHVLSAIVRVLAARLRETNDKVTAFFAMSKFE